MRTSNAAVPLDRFHARAMSLLTKGYAVVFKYPNDELELEVESFGMDKPQPVVVKQTGLYSLSYESWLLPDLWVSLPISDDKQVSQPAPVVQTQPAPDASAPVVQTQPAPDASAPVVQIQPAPDASAPVVQTQPAPDASAPVVQTQPAPDASAPVVQTQPAPDASAPVVQTEPAPDAPHLPPVG